MNRQVQTFLDRVNGYKSPAQDAHKNAISCDVPNNRDVLYSLINGSKNKNYYSKNYIPDFVFKPYPDQKKNSYGGSLFINRNEVADGSIVGGFYDKGVGAWGEGKVTVLGTTVLKSDGSIGIGSQTRETNNLVVTKYNAGANASINGPNIRGVDLKGASIFAGVTATSVQDQNGKSLGAGFKIGGEASTKPSLEVTLSGPSISVWDTLPADLQVGHLTIGASAHSQGNMSKILQEAIEHQEKFLQSSSLPADVQTAHLSMYLWNKILSDQSHILEDADATLENLKKTKVTPFVSIGSTSTGFIAEGFAGVNPDTGQTGVRAALGFPRLPSVSVGYWSKDINPSFKEEAPKQNTDVRTRFLSSMRGILEAAPANQEKLAKSQYLPTDVQNAQIDIDDWAKILADKNRMDDWLDLAEVERHPAGSEGGSWDKLLSFGFPELSGPNVDLDQEVAGSPATRAQIMARKRQELANLEAQRSRGPIFDLNGPIIKNTPLQSEMAQIRAEQRTQKNNLLSATRAQIMANTQQRIADIKAKGGGFSLNLDVLERQDTSVTDNPISVYELDLGGTGSLMGQTPSDPLSGTMPQIHTGILGGEPSSTLGKDMSWSGMQAMSTFVQEIVSGQMQAMAAANAAVSEVDSVLSRGGAGADSMTGARLSGSLHDGAIGGP